MAIEAAQWRDERQLQQIKTLAWYTAYLSRVKHFPKLKSLLNTKPARKLKGKELQERRQEFKEMSAAVDLNKLAEMKVRKNA